MQEIAKLRHEEFVALKESEEKLKLEEKEKSKDRQVFTVMDTARMTTHYHQFTTLYPPHPSP